MQIASTTSIGTVREKQKLDGRRAEVVNAIASSTEPSNKDRKFMLNTKSVSAAYLAALTAFVARLAKHQSKNVEENSDVVSITAAVEAGRKYDKIVLLTLSKHPKIQGDFKTETEARFFVERETGRIFGAKSPLAPNENRYFGKVENAKLWDWSGLAGEAVNDPSVTEVGSYGGVKHYAEVIAAEPVTA